MPAPRRAPSESLDQALLIRQQRREQRHVARGLRRLELQGMTEGSGIHGGHAADAGAGLPPVARLARRRSCQGPELQRTDVEGHSTPTLRSSTEDTSLQTTQVPAPRPDSACSWGPRHLLRRASSPNAQPAFPSNTPPAKSESTGRSSEQCLLVKQQWAGQVLAPLPRTPGDVDCAILSVSVAGAAADGTPRSVSLFPRSDSDASPGATTGVVATPLFDDASCVVVMPGTDEDSAASPTGTLGTLAAPSGSPKLFKARSARHLRLLSHPRPQQHCATVSTPDRTFTSMDGVHCPPQLERQEQEHPPPSIPKMQRSRSAHHSARFGLGLASGDPTLGSSDSACSSPGESLHCRATEGGQGGYRSHLAPIQIADPTHEDIWARYGAPWRRGSSTSGGAQKWNSRLWLEAVTRKIARGRLEREGAEALAALQCAQEGSGVRSRRGRGRAKSPFKVELSQNDPPGNLTKPAELTEQQGLPSRQWADIPPGVSKEREEGVDVRGEGRRDSFSEWSMKGHRDGTGRRAQEEKKGKTQKKESSPGYLTAPRSDSPRTSFSEWCTGCTNKEGSNARL